jgi:mannose-6-phosphate isomerase-like protein (cupin superfamily)
VNNGSTTTRRTLDKHRAHDVIGDTHMPVINEQTQAFPEWCELRSFDIFRLQPGEPASITPSSDKTLLIVGEGEVTVAGTTLPRGEFVSLDIATEATAGPDGATLIRMSGTWGDELGGMGLFGVREVDAPSDKGDPVDYLKATSFDAHYHDCDEYWIIFGGSGTVVSEGIAYDVGPGDCVATGMGHHHDFPRADEPIRAVFFETTLQGEKRRGHLWNHTHGPAQPQPDRV